MEDDGCGLGNPIDRLAADPAGQIPLMVVRGRNSDCRSAKTEAVLRPV